MKILLYSWLTIGLCTAIFFIWLYEQKYKRSLFAQTFMLIVFGLLGPLTLLMLFIGGCWVAIVQLKEENKDKVI